jgi:hypothetical protein
MSIKKYFSGLVVALGMVISINSVQAFSLKNIFSSSDIDPQHLINELSSAGESLVDYMTTKDYSKISDSRIRETVEHLCQQGCNRWTCKKAPIQQGCVTFCPANDVRNCAAAEAQ